LWHRAHFLPWDRPLVLTAAAFAAGTGAAVLLSRLVPNDLGLLAIAATLGGIPTLTVSVLAGGTDQEMLVAALNTMHRKVRLGYRGRHERSLLGPHLL
jgi:hypothetical protein